MNLQCTYETRTKKDGTTYKVVVIKLTDTLEKLVFLEPSEKELLEIVSKYKNSQTK